MKSLVLGGVLGGMILFLWSAVSWMALPWHRASIHPLLQQNVVDVVLAANAGGKGIYVLPSFHEKTAPGQKVISAHEKMQKGPFAFIAYSPQGTGPMQKNMIASFLIQTAAAALVTGLLLLARIGNYWKRLAFILLFALAAGVAGHLPHLIWWGFALPFTLLEIADLLAGWFLAGLVIAKVVR